MFRIEPLTFPKLKQVNADAGRHYAVLEGEDIGAAYPSVTTMLKARPKPQLEAWKKRVGAKEAARVSTRSTSIGSSLHALAECYLQNDHTTVQESLKTTRPEVKDYWHLIRPWLDEHIEIVHAQEQDVYSRRLQVAGRFDLLATVNGRLTVIDFKTALRYKPRKFIEDYELQVTFYSIAVTERLRRTCQHASIPILSDDGLQVFDVYTPNCYAALKDRVKEYRCMSQTSVV